MTRPVLAMFFLVPGWLFAAQLPPQTLSSELQPRDCDVIRAVLVAYSEYGRERGESSGFTGHHYFVGDRSQALSADMIPVSRYEFTPADEILFERIRTQLIFSSLVRRAGFSASLAECELPDSFAFAKSFESLHSIADEPWLSIMFQEYDGFVTLTLPGYSSNECQAAVELHGEYPIWEERLIYYLRASETGWVIDHVFQSMLQGE